MIRSDEEYKEEMYFSRWWGETMINLHGNLKLGIFDGRPITPEALSTAFGEFILQGKAFFDANLQKPNPHPLKRQEPDFVLGATKEKQEDILTAEGVLECFPASICHKMVNGEEVEHPSFYQPRHISDE